MYEGEAVTFLLSVGLQDIMASQAWGMLTNLCGSGSGKVIGLRMKPARMDRQPIAKVVAERFPPPPPSRRAARATVDEAAEDKAQAEAENLLLADSTVLLSACQQIQCMLFELQLSADVSHGADRCSKGLVCQAVLSHELPTKHGFHPSSFVPAVA